VVGHNDIDFGNIVFREGTPVALIDFDYVAPSDLVWEVGVAAFYLVPLRVADDTAPDASSVKRGYQRSSKVALWLLKTALASQTPSWPSTLIATSARK